ncbi:MFS transporter [Bifidobacterium phasiani]|uniref:MFS transporter n=1 Tax=Bifidobacterium phasiani TaxID=2834431 RepID=A0ABS6W8V8_9BIFI|nr:MFS transporter [Bifidobacterium phasiani]MBW3082172.1 MFS transporter [Bifidobacterium phasiani]
MAVSTKGAGARRAPFGLPMLYWGLWLAILILWMGRFVTSFLSIYLVSDLHIDEGVVGTVVSMYGFGSIVGCLFGGALSDRFGRQPMIVVGELGAAATLLVVSALADPVALGVALFAYGAVSSLASPAIAAYIADVVPPESRQRAYTLQSWAINFGYAIGPVVANQLVRVSYALMFYVEAAVLVGVTALLAVFFHEARVHGLLAPAAGGGREACGNRAGAGAAPAEPSGPDAAAPAGASMLSNYRRVLSDVPFLAFVMLMFGYFIAYFQSTSSLPIAMTDLGMGTGEYSILLSINGGMLCLLQIPMMRLFRRMGNSRVLVCGLAVTVAGYALQIVADSWGGFALATVLWTLGELGTFPIATTTVAAMAPAQARGTYQGVYNVLQSLSIAFAPLAGGWVISHAGGRTLWVACTALLALVAFGMWATRRSRERESTRSLQEVAV